MQQEIVFDIETWKDYPEHPDRYEVSSFGRVKSKLYVKEVVMKGKLRRMTMQPKLLVQFQNKQGYMQLRLMADGVKFTRRVHRMVAETFLFNPSELPVINHKNSNRLDNHVFNLEWVTQQENIQHSYNEGNKTNLGVAHPGALLNDEVVIKIKLLEREGFTCTKISEIVGFKFHTAYKVLKRRNWKHVEPE